MMEPAADIEEHRLRLLEAYRAVHVPVYLGLSACPTARAGTDHSDQAWRAGVDRLRARAPQVRIEWLDSDHAIPLRLPARVAAVITERAPNRTG